MSRRTRILAGWIVTVAFLASVPFWLSSTWTSTVTLWIPIAIAALGLNLLTGYNGQVSIGHGALYGVGAYAAALTVNAFGGQFLLGVLVAAAVGFALGIVIGLPALRIKGLYLALVTLTFAALFPSLLDQFGWLTNSPNILRITTPGLYNGLPRDILVTFVAPSWSGLADDQWRYLWVLAIAVVCFILVRNLVNSRIGRAMVAIRDNEIAAETNGVNVAFVKVMTFGLSASLAGIGGALFALAQDQPQLNKGSFTFALSLTLMVVVVIGGPATMIGPAIGAFINGFFNDVVVAQWLPESWAPLAPIVLAALLIGAILLAPGGTAGSVKQLWERRQMRAATESDDLPAPPTALSTGGNQ
jgi:branched-chain amino acid transport system permease protein